MRTKNLDARTLLFARDRLALAGFEIRQQVKRKRKRPLRDEDHVWLAMDLAQASALEAHALWFEEQAKSLESKPKRKAR